MKDYFGRNNQRNRPQNPRLLIVCEDQKHTPAYLKAVCDTLGIQRRLIDFEFGGSAPISVVKHARKCVKQAKNEGNEFDKIFIVIDRDNHTKHSEAMDTAQANKFDIINSDPCFELWLLLHFNYEASPMTADDVFKKLRAHIASFDKKTTDYGNLYTTVLKDRTKLAIKNSRRLDKEMNKCGSENPKTNFFKLIESLRDMGY